MTRRNKSPLLIKSSIGNSYISKSQCSGNNIQNMSRILSSIDWKINTSRIREQNANVQKKIRSNILYTNGTKLKISGSLIRNLN